MTSVNKVMLANGTTLIDLTADTVLPSLLYEGYTAHAANGEPIVGTLIPPITMNTVESDVFTGDAPPVSTVGSNGDTYFEYYTPPAALVSDGNSWINTGVAFSSYNSVSYEVEFAYTNTPVGDQALIGFNDGYNVSPRARFTFEYMASSNGIFLRASTSQKNSPTSTNSGLAIADVINAFHTLAAKETTFSVDGVTISTFSRYGATPYYGGNILLFATIQSGAATLKSKNLAISRAKIFNAAGTTLYRDFTPSIDEFGVPYMYDSVSETKYYNAGTGTFGYLPGTEKRLKNTYVKRNGTWESINL